LWRIKLPLAYTLVEPYRLYPLSDAEVDALPDLVHCRTGLQTAGYYGNAAY